MGVRGAGGAGEGPMIAAPLVVVVSPAGGIKPARGVPSPRWDSPATLPVGARAVRVSAARCRQGHAHPAWRGLAGPAVALSRCPVASVLFGHALFGHA